MLKIQITSVFPKNCLFFPIMFQLSMMRCLSSESCHKTLKLFHPCIKLHVQYISKASVVVFHLRKIMNGCTCGCLFVINVWRMYGVVGSKSILQRDGNRSKVSPHQASKHPDSIVTKDLLSCSSVCFFFNPINVFSSLYLHHLFDF